MKLKIDKRIFAFNLEVELVEKFKELYPNASKKINELLQDHLNEKNVAIDSLIIRNLKKELGSTQMEIDTIQKTQKEWNQLIPSLVNKREFLAKEIGRIKKEEK